MIYDQHVFSVDRIEKVSGFAGYMFHNARIQCGVGIQVHDVVVRRKNDLFCGTVNYVQRKRICGVDVKIALEHLAVHICNSETNELVAEIVYGTQYGEYQIVFIPIPLVGIMRFCKQRAGSL